MRIWAALVVLATAAAAQTAAPLSFEVASIKPAPPPAERRPIGNRVVGDRLDYQYATLRQCIAFGFGVNDYQITGPAWLSDARWRIEAKAPDGSTREQMPERMRTLLAERFKLVAHVERQDFDGLALVVGKGGPKMERGTPDPAGGMSFRRQFRFGGGGGRVESPNIPMFGLAGMLANILGRPVSDDTGLAGAYKVSFEYKAEEGKEAVLVAVNGPPPPETPDPFASIFTSIQSLGLKLETRKVTPEMVVVERAEKTPTEN